MIRSFVQISCILLLLCVCLGVVEDAVAVESQSGTRSTNNMRLRLTNTNTNTNKATATTNTFSTNVHHSPHSANMAKSFVKGLDDSYVFLFAFNVLFLYLRRVS
jgi:hypothetical protein